MRKPTARDVRMLTLYDITETEDEKVLRLQGGACAICRRPPVKYRLGTDHDHKTGAVRGKLCRQCNNGVAYFRDSAALLAAAADYLNHPPSFLALGRIPVGRVGRVTRKWKTKTERRERMREVALRLQAEGFEVPRSIKKIVNG